MNEYDVTMRVLSRGLIMEYLRQMAVSSEKSVVMKQSTRICASVGIAASYFADTIVQPVPEELSN
jgi:hypothetical protein